MTIRSMARPFYHLPSSPGCWHRRYWWCPATYPGTFHGWYFIDFTWAIPRGRIRPHAAAGSPSREGQTASRETRAHEGPKLLGWSRVDGGGPKQSPAGVCISNTKKHMLWKRTIVKKYVQKSAFIAVELLVSSSFDPKILPRKWNIFIIPSSFSRAVLQP